MEGNRIGVDIAGSRALGNSGDGLGLILNDAAMVIGNVVSANGGRGVVITTLGIGGSGGAMIQGNDIGTDSTGKSALGNAGAGLAVGGEGEQIGGTGAGQGNVVSANGGDGITLDDDLGTNRNVLRGNAIGTDGSATIALGNLGRGISIGNQSNQNQVGGTLAGAGDVIANNRMAGVSIVSGYLPIDGNSILSNSIYGNGGLGIELNNDGVTLDHVGGPISGANDAQNFPVLASVVSVGGKTTVAGSLNGAAGTSYSIQFFASPAADPSGYGQGRTFLGSATVATDPSGNKSFSAVLPVAIAAGQVVTATATDPNGNTSEFARDVTVDATQATLTAGVASATFRQAVTFVAAVAARPGCPRRPARSRSSTARRSWARRSSIRPATRSSRPPPSRSAPGRSG